MSEGLRAKDERTYTHDIESQFHAIHIANAAAIHANKVEGVATGTYQFDDYAVNARIAVTLPRQDAHTDDGKQYGREGAGLPRLMIKGDHQQCGHDGIHKVNRRGYTTRQVIIAVDEKQRTAVRKESQIGQRDQLAPRNPKTAAHQQHDYADNAGCQSETIKQDGVIAQEISRISFFYGHREERYQAVANRSGQTGHNALCVGRVGHGWNVERGK